MELFTTDDAAMLLIDHQVGTIKLSRNIDQDLLIRNTRALARTAVATKMPLILTTSQEDHFQGRLIPDLEEIAPKAYQARVKRPGTVDAFTYDPFRSAVEGTGKRKLIIAGLTNDVCTVFPSISARAAGYDVQLVIDGGGSPNQVADEMAAQRAHDHGVVVTTTNQCLAELATDWSSENGQAIQGILYEELLKPFVEE
ncbi:isochorismatase family protein [Parvularcula maris]|uniref:Isochorismatase family protein n=1 Tax=Parvularcula maris TaxID=2965077 RepID=A0A9X2LBS3_9PROT|nr:isochorismatase family protein [Parvularcula maris]MCQ8186626.1 isochorismatase family protein [Parvularcula maris]